MASEHPQRELLERFLGGELPPEERRTVVRHLLTGCPQCTTITREIWSLTGSRERLSAQRRYETILSSE